MESLGGDQFWIDRFAAQHAAVFYYWVIVGFFAFSPQLAYVFSELVEVALIPFLSSKTICMTVPTSPSNCHACIKAVACQGYVCLHTTLPVLCKLEFTV